MAHISSVVETFSSIRRLVASDNATLAQAHRDGVEEIAAYLDVDGEIYYALLDVTGFAFKRIRGDFVMVVEHGEPNPF